MKKVFILGILLLLVIITIIIILMDQSDAIGEGKIVFAAFNGNPTSDIFSIDINGKDLQNLTNHPAIDDRPVASPDGKHIVFTSNRNGRSEIFIMDAGGKNTILLVDNVSDRPTWSPDSMRIAFVKLGTLFAVNIDSGVQKEIYKAVIGIPGMPSWSPNGRRIAFRILGANGGDIYTINIDGANIRQLTKDPEDDLFPVYSPDGTKIAFHSARDGGGIFVMDSDGANVKRIGNIRGRYPSWSPDGQKIVFSSDSGIFVMNSDGSNVKQIANEGWMPSWLELSFNPFNIELEGKWKTVWSKIKRDF